MKKLKIEKTKKSNDTVTRTIRISGETFDKISDLVWIKKFRRIIKFIDFIINSKYNNNRKWRNHKRGLPGLYVKNTLPGQDRCVFLLVIYFC